LKDFIAFFTANSVIDFSAYYFDIPSDFLTLNNILSLDY